MSIAKNINKLRRLKRDLTYFADDLKRGFSPHTNEIINEKEIRVAGLRRSGNHAIVTWLRRHYDQRIWHLNNILPSRNPFRQLAESYPNKAPLIEQSKGNFVCKECLIYNYENCSLESIANSRCEQKHDLYLGRSQERYDLLIIRDPYNTFASICKGNNKSKATNPYSDTYPKNYKTIAELWLEYAKEYLGETNYLPHNKVVVNYNQWVSDRSYRQSISQQLGLDFCDAGFNTVKDYGGGSSFDGNKFDSKASEMAVFSRWQELKCDRQYQEMFDPEITEYSRKIFGTLPGTDELFSG